MTELQFWLTKLAEECCEVAQAASKASLFGLESDYAGKTNKQQLHDEIVDVLTIIEVLKTKYDLNLDDFEEKSEIKLKKLRFYRGLSVQLGFVDIEERTL